MVIEANRSYRFSETKGKVSEVSTAYGTELGTYVDTYRADARALLYSLLVLLADDCRTSDAVANGSRVSTRWRDAQTATVRFNPPSSLGIAIPIEIDVDMIGGFPVERVLESPDFGRSSISLSPPGLAAAPWQPITVSRTERAHSGKVVHRSVLWIDSVEPLSSPPPPFVIPRTASIYDESTGLRRRLIEDSTLLQASAASKTLDFALRGQVLNSESKANTMTCGIDCVYYLMRLNGSSPEPQAVLNAFNKFEDGVSLLEMASAAKSFGWTVQAKRSADRDVSTISKPSILAWTKGHFVVVLPERDGHWTVIDPPYAVRRMTDTELKSVWTGHMMSIERGQDAR